MNKNVRIKRLEILLDLMLNHNKYFKTVEFDMNIFYSEFTDKNKCDSAACALGSAALHKPFKKSGLKLDDYQCPTFQGECGFQAGVNFFDITQTEAGWLFDPSCYQKTHRNGQLNEFVDDEITTKMVAKRIKKLLDHYKKCSEPMLRDVRYNPSLEETSEMTASPLPFDYLNFACEKLNYKETK